MWYISIVFLRLLFPYFWNRFRARCYTLLESRNFESTWSALQCRYICAHIIFIRIWWLITPHTWLKGKAGGPDVKCWVWTTVATCWSPMFLAKFFLFLQKSECNRSMELLRCRLNEKKKYIYFSTECPAGDGCVEVSSRLEQRVNWKHDVTLLLLYNAHAHRWSYICRSAGAVRGRSPAYKWKGGSSYRTVLLGWMPETDSPIPEPLTGP